MPNPILFLFPDTNLFIECKPLADLDWSDWKEFPEIHLVVCRPVQREIDQQKNRGNDRVGQRARAANGCFRKIIQSGQDYQPIKESSPAVKLFIGGPRRPSSGLDDLLDYTKPDDEIVGYLHRFLQEHPGVDARLLTNDTGPMMTAKTLELPFVPIKDNWLQPPEHNTLERENARLKATITQLKKAEPQFNIELVNDEGETLQKLNAEFNHYQPLSADDRKALMQQLSDHFPIEDDFGPLEPIEEPATGALERIAGAKWVYTPAPPDAIAKYTQQEYPQWAKDCENVLSNLHNALRSQDGQPSFTFSVSNEGSRPGNDAIALISALGNFKICPPAYVDEDLEEEPNPPKGPALPRPPRPPKGRWKSVIPQLGDPNNVLLGLRTLLAERWNTPTKGINFDLPYLPTIPPIPYRRDPNGFYYKPARPAEPQESFTLECEQWRHQSGPEHFAVELFFDDDTEPIRGALRCEIHAENLSTPTEATFPVRVTINRVDTQRYALELVQNLIHSAM